MSAGAQLAVTGAVGDVQDRRRRFEAEHPDVEISAPETHASLWTARRAGRILASDYQLEALMDALDWLTGKPR